MPLGPKMDPPRGHMFYIGLYKEKLKKKYCLKPQGMKHHLSDLYQVCSNYAPWAKLPCPKDHMFYKGLYRNLHGKILSKSTRHRALIFGYVASPSGPLPKLFNLCSCGQKWARPRGHRFCIGLYMYRENMNKSLNMRKQKHLSKFHCLDFLKML